MKYILIIFLCFTAMAITPVQEAAQIETSIENGELLKKTEKALTALILTASGELKKRGYSFEAVQLESEYFNWHQYDLRVYASSRGLGDYEPFSKWLKEKTDLLTFILGIDVMKKTHLIDLVVFNHAPRVVFKPCEAPWGNKVEYRNHFSKDENYQGTGEVVFALVPVISYWISYGTCVGASMGTGYVLVCGLAGNVVERIVGNFVSDGLSDRVWERACGN